MNKRLIIINLLLVVAIIGSWLVFMGDFRQKEPTMEVTADVQEAPMRQETEAVQTPVEDVQPQETEPEEAAGPEEPEPVEDDALEQLLSDFCEKQDGDWSIVVETLDGRNRAEVNGNASMISASLIKLFVMAAVYDQIEQGMIAHEEVIDLIRPMITISDNTATNRLIEKLGGGDANVGMKVVNEYAAALGCEQTKLCRLMLANNGLQNYTSASDCAMLLRSMCELACVSEAWSREMLDILKEQTVRTRIPDGLPEGVPCGNKTGDLIGLCCADVGIVFAETGDYIVCLICNGQSNDMVTTFAMAELSGKIYDRFTQSEA